MTAKGSLLPVIAASAVLASALLAVVPEPSQAAAGAPRAASAFEPVCAGDLARLACQVGLVSPARSGPLYSGAAPVGWGAPDLQQAYNLPDRPLAAGTIAIIDVGAYPTLESDLAVYRQQYGLPACTAASGCFQQMDYHGGAALPGASTPDDKSIDQEIGIETSLDVDMASAACPACRILEVQIPHSATPTAPADPSQPPDYDGYADSFGTAAQTAIAHGAAAISMSYGLPGDDHMLHSAVASQLAHRGVAIVAASGDAGFQATHYLWPQALPTVTAVGGTELVKESGHFSEGAWSSGGSSCVPTTAPPTGQQTLMPASTCSGARASVDVSAAADNLAIYDNYSPATNHPIGWTTVAGTSAAAPFIAGLYAATGNLGDVLGPNTLYSRSPAKFHDITSGTNGAITNGRCVSNTAPTAEDGTIQTYDTRLCAAGPGWDGPTGLGSPRGLLGP